MTTFRPSMATKRSYGASVIGVVVLVVVAGSYALLMTQPRRAPQPALAPSGSAFQIAKIPADASVSALLDGLSAGDSVDGGWTVVGIYAPQLRRVYVELNQGSSFFMVTVGRKGSSPHPPPVETEMHDLTFGIARGAPSRPEDVQKALAAIADRVRRAEKKVPTPPGL